MYTLQTANHYEEVQKETLQNEIRIRERRERMERRELKRREKEERRVAKEREAEERRLAAEKKAEEKVSKRAFFVFQNQINDKP